VCNRVYLRTVTVLFFGPLCRWQQRCGLLLSVGLLQLLAVVTLIRERSIVMSIFTKFLGMLPMTVARFFCGGIVIHYVLPVLCRAS